MMRERISMKKLFCLLAPTFVWALGFDATTTAVSSPPPKAGVQSATAAAPPAPRKNVAILIFDGVQIIDYTGPYEVFGQAGFNTFTVAEKSAPVTTAMGMIVTPNHSLEQSPKPDIIVIPGGDVDPTVNSPKVIKWIQDSEKEAQYVLSVCNGAFILARTGLLDGLSTTTFYGLIDQLKAFAPKTKVLSDRRYVDNGKYISTAGISSGIDGSLYVVSKVHGLGKAQMVALNMEYNWDPDSRYARAAFADRHLRKIFGRGLRLESPAVSEHRVLQTKGGTESWEVVWEIRSETTAPELLKLLDRKLTTDAKWAAREPGASAGAYSGAWKFADESGEVWNGAASIRSVPGAAHRFTLALRVDRGANSPR
jgi:putative intracellular protease/amidase